MASMQYRLISSLFKAKFSGRSVLCLLMCVAGILCLCNSGGSMDGRGMLLAAGSGAVYAVYISGVEHSGLKELPVLLIIFWLCAMTAPSTET